MNFLNLFLILGVTSITVPSLTADNWPAFRGPNLQGISQESGFPLHWSAEDNIAWKVAISGEGWSSPIVWEDQVFITTATDGGTVCHVLALDRLTGSMLWDREVFQQEPGHKQTRNSYATPTPCTDGERVYAVFGDGSFVALDFSGNTVWTNRDFPFYGEHGLGTSPILWKDLLIMTRDGSGRPPNNGDGWHTPWDQARILALDKRNGALRWEAQRGMSRIAHVVPNVWTRGDGKAVLVSGAGDVVQGFDLETGQRLWTSWNEGEGVVPSIVLGEDRAFTASGWGGRQSIKAFRLGGSGDLGEDNLVWEQRKGVSKIPSYLYLDIYLYTVNERGVVMCLDSASGEIVWDNRIEGDYAASPVAAGDRIYFVNEAGLTTVLKAGPEFEVLATNPIGGKVEASPALSQGMIFIRTETHLVAIGKGGS